MLYLTDPGIWAGVAALVVTVWIRIKLAQHDRDLAAQEEREMLRGFDYLLDRRDLL